MKLTIAIITKHLPIPQLVLDSVKIANEIIIIVDSEKKIPQKRGIVRTYFRPLNGNFAKQRNYALKKARGEWILFLDDDEYLGTELAREIERKIKRSQYSGYYIPRHDVCFHQLVRHGETGHTKILRLAKKESGIFFRSVHEVWRVRGKTGELSTPIYHIKDSFVNEFIGRMIQYSPIDATILTKEKKPFSLWRLILNPKAKFIQNYLFRCGFIDGLVGLFQAYLMSVQSLTVRIFQWTDEN